MSTIAINPVIIKQNNCETVFSRHPVVRQVALRTLKELAIAIASITICLPFVASTSGIAIIIAAYIISIAVNTILHSISLNAKDQLVRTSAQLYKSTSFALANSNVGILVHEAGHYYCAKKLITGKPSIELIPFQGGATSYGGKLTSLGKKLGWKKTDFLITLAGPSLAILVATIAFVAGLALLHSHPQSGSDLLAYGSMEFLNHSFYALSALWTPACELSHDFICLQTFGIHPLAACIVIVSIPIILCLGYSMIRYVQHNK